MTSVRQLLLLCALALPGSAFSAAAIPTNASANLVLGQALFTTNTTQTPATGGSLNLPTSAAVDPVSGRVFVADLGNNRVLRYPSAGALTSGAAPDLVIGQVNFSSSASNQGLAGPTQTSLSAPGAVFVDAAGNLWIADTGNNRVLMFANAANLTAVPANADRVFGQPNFTSNTAAPTQSTFAAPAGLCVDPAGTLWVADTGSHRVLGFKNAAAALVNGPNADRELGQAAGPTAFTSNSAGTTQAKFFRPTGVSASATQLWVADSGNNRVLLFPNYPTVNGAPAGLVLGQTTYLSSTPATSASGLTGPTSVAVSGGTVWVADSSNNRILNYAITDSTPPGAAAAIVVGQAGFTTGSSGLSAQKLTLDGTQIFVDAGGSLWVGDQLNNRVLRFSPASTPTPEPTTVKFTTPATLVTTKSSVVVRGTASSSAGVARVSYKIGTVGYFRATGTTSWKATIPIDKNGVTKLEFIAVGKDGINSAPNTVKIKRVTKPTVAVNDGLSVTTTASSVVIKGTAAAPAGVDHVSWQVGKQGYFRATGANSWKATISLKAASTKVEFRAVDRDGAVSAPVYVTITRN